MSDRRKEIARICEALEGEKNQIERRLKELYEEDNKLWEQEQALIQKCVDCGKPLKEGEKAVCGDCIPF